MMTYYHHETAVDTLSGHTPSGHTLSMPALRWPLLSPAAPVVRCLCAARCVSAVCRLCERCVLLFLPVWYAVCVLLLRGLAV